MAVEPLIQPEQHIEVPPTLAEAEQPRWLGFWDQASLWANLGITLTLPLAAGFVLAPLGGKGMSMTAAITAVVAGSLIGTLLLALGALPGAETGAPAMVLLRGLFGRRGSYVPTLLNLIQCIGWATFEVFVIAEAASQLTTRGLRPVYVVLAGALATLMALRPLGSVRVLRRYALWVVAAATAYLFIQIARKPLHAPGTGWGGFWIAADVVIAIAVSWIPLAADYSRNSRNGAAAFNGAFAGFGLASIAYFSLGVLAVVALPAAGTDAIKALLALPGAAVAIVILVLDELDEAFANVYSTVVSMQNIGPRLDRRILAIGVGAAAVVLGLVVHVRDYVNFLYLIGSVFVPLFATFAVDYYLLRRRRWDVSDTAKPRWEMLVPWVAGFVMYQLLNPGTVSWWQRFWVHRQHDLHLTPPTWASASLASFLVAAVLAVPVGLLRRQAATSTSVGSTRLT